MGAAAETQSTQRWHSLDVQANVGGDGGGAVVAVGGEGPVQLQVLPLQAGRARWSGDNAQRSCGQAVESMPPNGACTLLGHWAAWGPVGLGHSPHQTPPTSRTPTHLRLVAAGVVEDVVGHHHVSVGDLAAAVPAARGRRAPAAHVAEDPAVAYLLFVACRQGQSRWVIGAVWLD